MDFKQMISFQQVAYYKSFSKASQKLFFSQPTVTSHISELERELEVKLFYRNKSKVDLTPFGETFLLYVNQIIALQDEALKTLESQKVGKLGNIKLALIGSAGYWVFPLIEKFKNNNKKIDFEIRVTNNNSIIEMVTNRQAHFGFISKMNNFTHPLLVSRAVAYYESNIVFSPNHRFAKFNEITLSDISKEPLIIYGKKTDYYDQIVNLFNDAGLIPKIHMDAYDYQTIKIFLQKTSSVAFLPNMCVEEEISNGTLKTLPIKDCPSTTRSTTLIYRHDTVFTQPLELFLDIMIKKAEDTCIKSRSYK